MKFKKIIFVFFILTMLFSLTGCFLDKNAISVNEFIDIVSKNNLSTTDIHDQMSQYKEINSAIIASSKDNWKIEFYVLDNKENALKMYNTNKSIFEGLKGKTNIEKYLSLGNYSLYDLKTDYYYMHLCRVDNTLLYVKVDVKYENDVKKIIDKLGY